MIPVYTLALHLGHVCIYFSIQRCNFSTQLAFYILFELCIFYLLLRSAAANVTCFYTLALSLSLYLSCIHSNVHTHTHMQTHRDDLAGFYLGVPPSSCCFCCRFLPLIQQRRRCCRSTCLFRTLALWECVEVHVHTYSYVDADGWLYVCVYVFLYEYFRPRPISEW